MSEPPPENTGRNPDGRFAPGARANPSGKPKGARHKVTVLAEKLFSADAAKIIKKVVTEAENGQSWACKLVIERIIPPARDRATPFDLPKIEGLADLPVAVQAVLAASAAGDLSLEDAERAVALLTALGKAFEGADLAARVSEMEAQIAEIAKGRPE